ncbi:MAG: serine/threonine protein kinase [Oligosphaeraceae bacterium]|nr:serine/threonine protein kinase [Oligosphaeraceae bacterium]
MAVVYLAKQVDLQRPVALKVLSLELSSNRSFVKRFFNEVRTAAALSHPNIIQAYDAGIANGDIYYFAMEYVRGETLLERITREQCLKVPAALKYALEIANALNYGWQRQRLTHGDIKPDNIMVNDLDQAKLADFGLAKVTGHEYEGHELMLTPHYASPELINGKNPKNDCRADIYAFGASMYHLLAGSPPYPGNDGQEVMRRHLGEELEPLAQRKPGIAIQLSDFIGRMLAKDPAARPADWNAVLEELDRCEKSLVRSPEEGRIVFKLPPERARMKGHAAAAPAAPVPVPARPRNLASAWWLLSIVLASMLLVILGFLYWRKLQARQDSDTGITVTYKEPERPAVAAGETSASAEILPVQVAPAVVPAGVNGSAAAAAAPVQALQVTPPGQPSQEGSVPPVAVQETPVASTASAGAVPTGDNSGEAVPAPAPASANASQTSAARVAHFPDYSLRPDFTLLQRKSFALLQAWQIFASFRHIPGQLGSAERKMVALNDWLSRHGPGSTEFELVQFVKTEVIPLLDEGPAKLALNKNAVLGRTFRSRGKKNIQLVVRDVYPDGILADWQLEKGTMQRRVTWRELEDTQTNILLDMYKVAFFDNTLNGNPEFYLAQLVFSNYSRLNQPALPVLSKAALRNRSKWERLFEMTYISDARDREALKLLSELPGWCARGSRIEAGRASRRLLSINSTLANQYRDLPEAVLAVCGRYLPEVQGGLLVRQAQDLLNDHPEQALSKLNAAAVLYGQVKFPEQEQIGKLQSRASRRLAESLSGAEVTVAAAWPFVNVRPAGVRPGLGYAQIQILEKEALISKTELSALRALVNLDAGAWPRKGEWLSAEEQQALYAAGEPLSSTAVRYASWLLELRRGLWFFPENEEFLRGLPQEQYGNLAHGLLLQLCLLSRQADAAQQGAEKLLQPLYLWSRGEQSQLPDRWRLLLSLLLEAGRHDDVRRALGMVRNYAAQQQGMEQAFKDEMNELASALRPGADGTVPAATLVLPAELPVSEYQLRLRLALLQQQPLDDSADASMRSLLNQAVGGFGQVGGDALFDWLLRRVAWELQKGDISNAYKLCEQLLELEQSCLFACLPRIYFLQAGLLLLNGQTAGLTDAYHVLRFGTMASEEQELRVLEQSKNGEIKITSGDLKTPSGPYFWLEWLRCCQSLGEHQTEVAIQSQTLSLSCFNAEKALLAGLETYSRTFLPVSSGKEK